MCSCSAACLPRQPSTKLPPFLSRGQGWIRQSLPSVAGVQQALPGMQGREPLPSQGKGRSVSKRHCFVPARHRRCSPHSACKRLGAGPVVLLCCNCLAYRVNRGTDISRECSFLKIPTTHSASFSLRHFPSQLLVKAESEIPLPAFTVIHRLMQNAEESAAFMPQL